MTLKVTLVTAAVAATVACGAGGMGSGDDPVEIERLIGDIETLQGELIEEMRSRETVPPGTVDLGLGYAMQQSRAVMERHHTGVLEKIRDAQARDAWEEVFVFDWARWPDETPVSFLERQKAALEADMEWRVAHRRPTPAR